MNRALDSGAAAERFERMVAALGGPADFVANARARLPTAPVVVAAAPLKRGFVRAVDARAVGLAVVELGGGRRAPADVVDPAVGLTELAGIGDEVGAGRPLAQVHARDDAAAARASARLAAAYDIGDEPSSRGPTIIERVVA